jgi:predicted MPP superfamily phosphohydrolase
MFHFYILLAYLLPGIYLFFRIKYLFIGKKYRLLYISIFLALWLIYPISEGLSREETGLFFRALSLFSGFLLAFYLYLFLSLIVFEFFLITNRLFGFFSTERRRGLSFRISVFSGMMALSILTVVAGIINLNTIRVSSYQIKVPAKCSTLDHLRIVYAADLHIQQNTSLRFIEQFVRKANNLNTDLMLYGGDIVEGDRADETNEQIESLLRQIRTSYGSFAVIGNHEMHRGQQQWNFFRKAGISLLCDTVIRMDSLFYLAGRLDERAGNRKTVQQLLDSTLTDLPVILLDHRPTDLEAVSRSTADIQLSGHTHHGQMFPINLITKNIYELSWGYKRKVNTHFFVTSGLRLWGPAVKTAGKSEIILVDVSFYQIAEQEPGK